MPSDLEQFLRTVLRSGLMDRDELQTAVRAAPRDLRDQPISLADYFVKHGKLTRFQARKLLQGAAFGLVLGPFQVLAPIGKGGMGSVFLALDNRNQQRLALKVLPPKKAKEEERYLARFRREMELSRRVRHPNLALTFEVGECQGIPYIAMEYIPGMSLHRLVVKEGRLELTRAARLFTEVCAGLDHAHEQGLIHRDLKPSNIMVTPNNHAKILDLGLALMEGEVVEDPEVVGGRGYIVGSMDYIAPEQTQDPAAVDPRADIYALGCSLFFALTGRPPFPGGTNREKMKHHRLDEPEFVTRLNPRVPAEFAGVIHKMMAKDPALRYPSAYEARAALLAWTGGMSELPMEQQGDRTFQAAVQALVTAEPSTELDVPPLEATPPPSLDGPLFPSEKRNFLWLVAALLGFWLLLFTGLIIILLVK